MNPDAILSEIARRHGLDGPFERPTPGPAGEGRTNHVFTNGREVVRFARDPQRGTVTDAGEFGREAWAARMAATVGVPTPEVLVVDELVLGDRSIPFQVQRFVAGEQPTGDTPDLWRRLGEYAARLATIPLDDAPDALFSRFGRDLPRAWAQHVAYNLSSLGDGDRLLDLGVYELDDLEWVVESILACRPEASGEPPGLAHGMHHGDLNPGNVLVRADGELVLIDWGSTGTGPVPWGDLIHLHRMERLGSARQREGAMHDAADFAAAFGMSPDAVAEGLAHFELLQALDLVRWAIDRRPDLLADYAEQARETVRLLAPR